MTDEQMRTLIREIGVELGLANPEAIVKAEPHGVTFSWHDTTGKRQSFDILWTEFHRVNGSGYDRLKLHIRQEVAKKTSTL